MIVAAIICGSILFFQWRDQEFQKVSQENLGDSEAESYEHLYQAFLKLEKEFEEYKKRVDALTLKAGFKL